MDDCSLSLVSCETVEGIIEVGLALVMLLVVCFNRSRRSETVALAIAKTSCTNLAQRRAIVIEFIALKISRLFSMSEKSASLDVSLVSKKMM